MSYEVEGAALAEQSIRVDPYKAVALAGLEAA